MPPKKTLVIVGGHTYTRQFTPWTQKHKDFWVFNEAAKLKWIKKVDAVIQIHLPVVFRSAKNLNDPKHYEWLQEKHDFPVYMQEAYPEIPSAVKYPLDEICEKYLSGLYRKGKGRKKSEIRFFTSSVAYALALGIYQGYQKIEMYGVEMATDTEYGAQMVGVAFWLGLARGAGIEIQLHKESIVLKSLLYGYEGDIVIHRQAFENQAIALQRQLEDVQAKMNQAGGKVEEILKQMQEAEKDSKLQNKLAKDYHEANHAHSMTILNYGVVSGALQENQRYMEMVDEQIRSIGGEKAFEALMPVPLKEMREKTEGRENGETPVVEQESVSEAEKLAPLPPEAYPKDAVDLPEPDEEDTYATAGGGDSSNA